MWPAYIFIFLRFYSHYFYCIIHPRDPSELNTVSILHPCVFLIEKFKIGRYGLYRQLLPSFTSAYPASSVNKN